MHLAVHGLWPDSGPSHMGGRALWQFSCRRCGTIVVGRRAVRLLLGSHVAWLPWLPRAAFEPRRKSGGWECGGCGRREVTGRLGGARRPVPEVWAEGQGARPWRRLTGPPCGAPTPIGYGPAGGGGGRTSVRSGALGCAFGASIMFSALMGLAAYFALGVAVAHSRRSCSRGTLARPLRGGPRRWNLPSVPGVSRGLGLAPPVGPGSVGCDGRGRASGG